MKIGRRFSTLETCNAMFRLPDQHPEDSGPTLQKPKRRPNSAEPVWRKDGPQRPLRLQRLRFAVAGCGLLLTAILIAWISSWLRPPRTIDLVLVGADYAENLLVRHNCAGWKVLKQMATLPADAQLSCWGTDLFQLAHPPLRLHQGAAWDRGLDDCTNDTVFIYIAAHGAMDKDGAYLLLDDADAQNRAGRLRLEDVLERVAKLPVEQHKVLVLDCTSMVAEWNLGILINDFARGLEAFEEQIIAVPNLVVMSASDKDQRSWTCRSWQQTAFGHFMLEALKGGVDDTDHDGRIDAWDLYVGVCDATRHWAQAQQAARQTPTILPSGNLGRRRARKMDLMPAGRSYVPPPIATDNRFEVPAEIVEAWETHERLANQQPSPASYSPIAWRKYRDVLMRYEQLMLAGNRPAAARVHRWMVQCAMDVERYLTCELSSVQSSFGMYHTMERLGDSPLNDGVAIKDEQPVPDPQKSLDILWNASVEERSKKWDHLRNTMPGDLDGQRRLQMTLRELIFQRVKEDPPANLRTGAALVRLLDDPLHPRPVETHFLVMLDRDLPKTPWDDRRSDLVRLALETRYQAEQTAWCVRQKGNAYCEQVAPRVATLIQSADQNRRQGEDLLLGSPKDYVRSEQYLRKSHQQYSAVAGQITEITRAIEAYNQVMADLPYYARWVARRRADLRDNRTTQRKELNELEAICQSTHELGTLLTGDKDKGHWKDAELKRIVSQTDTVVGRFTSFEESVQEIWQMLVSADSPQAWSDLHDALRVPQKQSGLRMKLLTGLIQTQQRIARQATQRVASSGHMSLRRQSDKAKWSAQAEGRMALAVLGREQYQSLVPAAESSADKLSHRLEVFSVEQQWWKSAAIAGQAIAAAWCQVPQAIDTAMQTARQPDRAQAWPSLQRAEQLSRILPGALSLKVDLEPADVTRRARLQRLLEWQAERVFDDHWYAEDPTSKPYYCQVVERYLDDASGLLDRWCPDKQLRTRLTVESGLSFAVAAGYDMTSQLGLHVPISVTAQNDAAVPVGFPVVWFETGKSLVLSKPELGRRSWDWKGTSDRSTLTCEITSPFLAQAQKDLQPTATVVETELALKGRFRGQVISGRVPIHLHASPNISRVRCAAPPDARVAIRADKQIQQNYGTGRGSVAIVLDCSGSMGPPEGQPFGPHTKFVEATQALTRVLKNLPPGTTLSFWTFGQAVGADKTVDAPEKTIRRILDPVRWDPQDTDQLRTLMSRIEYPALEPWNQSPIVHAILAAKQDLQSLHGFKTIVVLTDGIDNRIATDKKINPQGKDVPTLLRDAFHGSDIELNVVGFKVAPHEAARNRQQFQVVESLFPPGMFCTTSESEMLVEALNTALRQRMRYWLTTPNHQDVASIPARGLEISLTGTNSQWSSRTLKPGNYWIDVNAVPGLEKAVTLEPGDRLLLRLAKTASGLDLQRVIYGAECFAWKPFQESGNWRATVLGNQRTSDDGLQMLLGLEPKRMNSNRELAVTRPDQVWIELESCNNTKAKPVVRYQTSWGHPLAAWNINAPGWPNTTDQQADAPRVKMWWSFETANLADVSLRRSTDFKKISDLQDKTLRVGEKSLRLDSVCIEEHWVQVAPERRERRSCLVIRLVHDPASTAWVRPGGLNQEGEEHHFYQDIGHYTGLFWPVADETAVAALQRLDIFTRETFQRAAEQRNNVITLDQLPPPDPNDVRPRPLLPAGVAGTPAA